MKIPLGSCKLYAKRNIPWVSAKWDLQNKRCAKYTLEKRAHPNVTLYFTLALWPVLQVLHMVKYDIM